MFLLLAIILLIKDAESAQQVVANDAVSITKEDLVFLRVGDTLMICNGYSESSMVYKATPDDLKKIQSIGGNANTKKVRVGGVDLELAYLVCDIGSESVKIGITSTGIPLRITGDVSEVNLEKIEYPCGDDTSLAASLASWRHDVERVIGGGFYARLTSQYDFNRTVFIILMVGLSICIVIVLSLIVVLSVKQHHKKTINAIMAASTTRDGLDYQRARSGLPHPGMLD